MGVNDWVIGPPTRIPLLLTNRSARLGNGDPPIGKPLVLGNGPLQNNRLVLVPRIELQPTLFVDASS
jgi:hypothetical protein